MFASCFLLINCKKPEEIICEKSLSYSLKNVKKTLKVNIFFDGNIERFYCGYELTLADSETPLLLNNLEIRTLKPFYLSDSIIAIGLQGGDPLFEAELQFTGNDFECFSGQAEPTPGSTPDTLRLPEVRVLSILPI